MSVILYGIVAYIIAWAITVRIEYGNWPVIA